MYEVFFNESRVLLVPKDEVPGLSTDENWVHVHHEGMLDAVIQDFLSGKVTELKLTSPDINSLWQSFCSRFRCIPAAGGLVQSPEGYLFIFRRGKWDLPKGKVDSGETPVEAALREVNEETGLSKLSISKALPFTWHIYEDNYHNESTRWVLKQTWWYSMFSPGDETLVPQAGEDISEARWFTIGQFGELTKNTYPGIRKLIFGILAG